MIHHETNIGHNLQRSKSKQNNLTEVCCKLQKHTSEQAVSVYKNKEHDIMKEITHANAHLHQKYKYKNEMPYPYGEGYKVSCTSFLVFARNYERFAAVVINTYTLMIHE